MAISIGDFVIINCPERLAIYKWHKNYADQIGLVVGYDRPGILVVAVKHYLFGSDVPSQGSVSIRHADGGCWNRSGGWPGTARLLCDEFELISASSEHGKDGVILANRCRELYTLLKSNFNEWRSGDTLPELFQ